jgi:hypothetical protein
VEVQDGQNNPVDFLKRATVTGTSYTITGLNASSNYKFKVRSVCGGDKSQWSAYKTFTTSPLKESLLVAENIRVNVYPNPVTTQFTIELSGNQPNANIRVINAGGVLVYEKSIAGDESNITVNTAEWSNGLYFAVISLNGKVETRTLNVAH